MVRLELRATVLAYNLVHTTGVGAALAHGKLPRQCQISFTSTCQYILSSWMLTGTEQIGAQGLHQQLTRVLEHLAGCEVANQPGRLEPRVKKLRPKQYTLMQKPRNTLRAELTKRCT